jgi:hypothetical protein
MKKAMRFLQGCSLAVCVTSFGIGSTYAEESKILTGADLKKMLSKDMYTAAWNDVGYRYIEAYTADGSYRALIFAPANAPSLQSTGTWQVEADELCIEFQDQNIGMDTPPTRPRRRCYQWQQNGSRFEVMVVGHAAPAYVYVLGD